MQTADTGKAYMLHGRAAVARFMMPTATVIHDISALIVLILF
jgi:hypothetical protein